MISVYYCINNVPIKILEKKTFKIQRKYLERCVESWESCKQILLRSTIRFFQAEEFPDGLKVNFEIPGNSEDGIMFQMSGDQLNHIMRHFAAAENAEALIKEENEEKIVGKSVKKKKKKIDEQNMQEKTDTMVDPVSSQIKVERAGVGKEETIEDKDIDKERIEDEDIDKERIEHEDVNKERIEHEDIDKEERIEDEKITKEDEFAKDTNHQNYSFVGKKGKQFTMEGLYRIMIGINDKISGINDKISVINGDISYLKDEVEFLHTEQRFAFETSCYPLLQKMASRLKFVECDIPHQRTFEVSFSKEICKMFKEKLTRLLPKGNGHCCLDSPNLQIVPDKLIPFSPDINLKIVCATDQQLHSHNEEANFSPISPKVEFSGVMIAECSRSYDLAIECPENFNPCSANSKDPRVKLLAKLVQLERSVMAVNRYYKNPNACVGAVLFSRSFARMKQSYLDTLGGAIMNSFKNELPNLFRLFLKGLFALSYEFRD